jgi:hypothetical protein
MVVGVGSGGGGETSSPAARRRRWLHVDMAGPSTDKASGRGTGCGVALRLRLELLTGALCAEATEYSCVRRLCKIRIHRPALNEKIIAH